MSELYSNYSPYEYHLQHYGVLGMKWGVRHDKQKMGLRKGRKSIMSNAYMRRRNRKIGSVIKKNPSVIKLAMDYNEAWKKMQKMEHDMVSRMWSDKKFRNKVLNKMGRKDNFTINYFNDKSNKGDQYAADIVEDYILGRGRNDIPELDKIYSDASNQFGEIKVIAASYGMNPYDIIGYVNRATITR